MSDDKLRFYNRFRKPPEIALKQIKAGRLKGFTDINPQWRIQALTELFGPVGVGWYTEIVDVKVEHGADGVVVASVHINLFWRTQASGGGWNEWSKPVAGIGGSLFVASEKTGLRTSDEAFKMAETDAISVACKKLGIAADVYWQHGSKYTAPAETNVHPNGQPKDDNPMPEHFPNEKEMQQGFTQWIAALKKYRKLSTFNEALRENDKQIKADLGGADSPFVLDFREWVVQRREELAE